MGLPLWQPKVESDIPSRPEAKNPEAHGRSPIRRGASARVRTAPSVRDRQGVRDSNVRSRDRERRRGLLQEVQERALHVHNNRTSGNNDNNDSNSVRQVMELADMQARIPRMRELLQQQRQQQRALDNNMNESLESGGQETSEPHQESAGFEGTIDRRMRQQYMREQQMLEARVQPRRPMLPPGTAMDPADYDRIVEQGDMNSATIHREMLNLRRARIEREAANAASRETEGANNNAADGSANTGAAAEPTRPRRRLPNSGLWSSDLENAIARTRERRERNEELLRDIWGEEDTDDGPPSQVARAPRTRVDGLGDRDRSLSPEGDNAWDTLLTTVTPDPQPPSVSSSFASFLSSVAGRTPANESSNTSMTGREPGAEESAIEQPCDSDEEGEPVRFDVDMDDDTAAQPSTYADVVRNAGYTMPSGVRTRTAPVGWPDSGAGTGTGATRRPRVRIERVRNGHIYASSNEPATDDLILQLVGGLGGMQHIVRNLVSREDIPNDWWVDAGLSRTLPRDGSGDEEGANN